jgi:FAD/FMN-containing dehydrogenase
VAVNGASRVVYGEELVAVYNDPQHAPGLPADAIAQLRGRMRGPLITPDDPAYDATRRVWNGSIDRHPGAIARCVDAADVAAALAHARRHDLPLAIRGGGHDVAGNGTLDAGLVLDLSRMKGIRVDPVARTARVEPGVVWGELDTATCAYSLAVTGGQISSTGVGGLTLGGGLGWLMRDLGLTVDSLLSADIITVEGEALTVDESQHADLFWAIRGGGGNFGVVTAFEFRLHPLGEIVGGTVAHSVERAREVLEFFRSYVDALPDSLTPMAYFFTAPPIDALPEVMRGRALASIAVCQTGQDDRALEPLRSFGPPLVDAIRSMPYTQLQTLFDAGSLPGFFNYWKSHFLQPLSSAAADTIAAFVQRMTSPLSIVLLTPMRGAVSRVSAEATAFGHREAPLVLEILAKWAPSDADQAPVHSAWADSFWAAMQPFATGGVYVNFLGQEGPTRVRAAYTESGYRRLVDVKRRYDPTNALRLNQNIPPTA